MRKHLFYFLIAILSFVIGTFIVIQFYTKDRSIPNNDRDMITKRIEWFNRTIKSIEAENQWSLETSDLKNSGSITVQGDLDIKFLCLDVGSSQPDICTTILLGNSTQRKSLVIRLQTCNEQIKSNCIVWKPSNLCAENKLCSEKVKIYDSRANPVELWKDIEFKDGYSAKQPKNIQLKVTAKAQLENGKITLPNTVERIEIINLE
jgi:hypothetical protein